MPNRLPAIVVVTVLCLAAAPGRGLAQEGKGDYLGLFNVTLQGGYAIPNTDEYANTVYYQGAVGYSPVPWFELDIEVGRFATTVSQPEKNGVPTHTIASGDLTVLPVTLSAQVRYPVPEILSSLYFLGGAGYYFTDYGWSGASRDYFAGKQAQQSIDDAWGFHLGAGIEYHMTGHLSLVGEGRYLILAPRAWGSWTDENEAQQEFDRKLDLNTWLFTGGLKVVF